MSALRGEQCTARSKASGVQCRHMVIGGGPCHMHGGKAPQVARKRDVRVALAKALLADPRRSPDEVLADVAHQADYLMRTAREEIRTDDLTAATMGELVALTERAGQWAKTTLDAGLAERQTRVLESEAAALAAVVRRILNRLALTPEQRALVPVVVPEELRRVTQLAIGASSS